MVIVSKNDTGWSAFGLLGQGGVGKSTISFSLARLLVEKDGFIVNARASLRVIDDNFTLEDRVVSSADWGGDISGKQRQFIDYLRAVEHSDKEARPQNGKFRITSFIGWLLICGNGVSKYTIKKSDRNFFVSELLKLNPCHNPSQAEIDSQQMLREQIRDKFDDSWTYSIVKRSAKDEGLTEDLAQLAYATWHQSSFFSKQIT